MGLPLFRSLSALLILVLLVACSGQAPQAGATPPPPKVRT